VPNVGKSGYTLTSLALPRARLGGHGWPTRDSIPVYYLCTHISDGPHMPCTTPASTPLCESCALYDSPASHRAPLDALSCALSHDEVHPMDSGTSRAPHPYDHAANRGWQLGLLGVILQYQR
jgi:hypothetical protein